MRHESNIGAVDRPNERNISDRREMPLLGGLAVWAVLEMLFINKRDGQWQKPASVPFVKDVITAVITAAVFAALLYVHESLFGVSAI